MIPSDFSRPVLYASTGIPEGALDPDAVRVVERLQSAGFEAYLVGGCVRDLLLGRQPKDFDVATSARPRQVRRLFRHCRIIGRRFKLAHVVFRRPDGTEHIVETATFRQAPPPQEEGDETLLITDDNTFGTAAEDAARRDFTINALFLDPRAGRIIDFVHGLPDLQERRLATIGDPNIRLREDPVRILRAIKFASRLNFRISKETYGAMIRHAGDLAMAAVPRLLEEILRLLRGGHSYPAFRLLAECGSMQVILPEIAGFLTTEHARGAAGQPFIDLYWRDLQALDEAVHAGDPVAPAFLHALLFYRLFERECDPRRRAGGSSNMAPPAIAGEILEGYGRRMRVSKLDIARAREILASQHRFDSSNKKHFRPGQFARHDSFPEALALFRVHCVASGQNWELYDGWYQLYRRTQGDDVPRRHASMEDMLVPPTEPTARRDEGRRDEGRGGEGRTRGGGRFRGEREGVGRIAAAPSLPSAPSEPGFQELWGLPGRGPASPAREVIPKETAAKEVGVSEAEAKEPEPQEIAPAAEPRFADSATIALVAEMEAKRSRRAPTREPAPRGAREMLRFKIARPDAKFEFPAAPYITIDESPDFGDW